MEWVILAVVVVILLAVVLGSRPQCHSNVYMPPPPNPRRPTYQEKLEYEVKVGDAETKAANRTHGQLLEQVKAAYRQMPLWVTEDRAHRKVAIPKDWIQGETIVIPTRPTPLPKKGPYSTPHGNAFNSRLLINIDQYNQKVRALRRAQANPPEELVWLDYAQYHMLRRE